MFWVQELHRPAEANRVISYTQAALPNLFLLYYSEYLGGVAKTIKAVKCIPCQLLTTKPGHFLMHKL